MLPICANGAVQQNGQVIGHVRYINILGRLRSQKRLITKTI